VKEGLRVSDMSVNEASRVLRHAMRETIRRRSFLHLVQAALLVLAGLVALVSPLFASQGLMVVLGWLLIIVGLSSAIGLVSTRHVPHFWLNAVSAVLAVVVGWALVSRPEAGLLAVALLMVVFLMVDGIQRVVMGLMIRPMADWGWVLGSGVLGLVLASNLGFTAGWLIGFLLGLHLIAVGGALGWMAWNLRRLAA
jgi:uncharacterized membrane protein HdeD (DUF308 family)